MEQNNEELPIKLTEEAEIIVGMHSGNLAEAVNYLVRDNEAKDKALKKERTDKIREHKGKNKKDSREFTKVFKDAMLRDIVQNGLIYNDEEFLLKQLGYSDETWNATKHYPSIQKEIKSMELTFSDIGFMVACSLLLSKENNVLKDVKGATITSQYQLAKALGRTVRGIQPRIEKLEQYGLLKKTRDGYVLDENQTYFSRMAAKLPPLTEEEKLEIEDEYTNLI